MSENAVPDVTAIPLPKKSFLTKTNAIRVVVATITVAVVAVVVVKMKSDSVEEIVEAVAESIPES